jgi:hypothetical protein
MGSSTTTETTTTTSESNTPYERTKAGKMVSNTASDAKRGGKKAGHVVKRGAQKTGHAVKKGAKKVGNKAEDVVD